MHEDLDARLVFVVAPAEAVIDPQDRLEIGEQIGARQKGAHGLADEGRAAEAAADDDLIARLALLIGVNAQADVVEFDRRAILFRAAHRDLELPGAGS